MNKKFLAVLAASSVWGVTAPLHAAAGQAAPAPAAKVEVAVAVANPAPMVVNKEVVAPAEAPKDTKITTVLMNKGAGNENLVIKMVSACDQNNVWCVANDGKADAVYQLTSKGLEHSFDGVYVSAGKEIVTAINAQHEVFELHAGTGKDWKKIDGLKLSKVSRPEEHIGYGLLEKDKGGYTFLSYSAEDNTWHEVQDHEDQPAAGIVDVFANAENVVLALNDKGELLKGDEHHKDMFEKVKSQVKALVKEAKQAGKSVKTRKGRGKKAHGKKGKKGAAHDEHAADFVDANHDGKDDRDTDGDGKVSAAEQAAYDKAHPKAKHGKRHGKGHGKMIDANHDGKDDRDADGDGHVSDAEKAAYEAAHKADHPAAKKHAKRRHHKKGHHRKGKKAAAQAEHAADFVDENHDGKDDRDTDGDGHVSDAEKAAYAAAHQQK